MNVVVITGNLVRTPELRRSQDGKSNVMYGCVAVRREFKENGEYKSDFINFIAFGNQAEFLDKYAEKGSKIEATGRWQVNAYKKEDGKTAYSNDLVITNVNLLNKIEKEADRDDTDIATEQEDLPF